MAHTKSAEKFASIIHIYYPSSVSLPNRMTQTYTLNIKDEIHKKTYNLKFSGTSTILDVKSGIYALIDVPVRNQQWKGWPSLVKNDSIMLAQSGISYPEHDLSVNELPMKEEKEVFILITYKIYIIVKVTYI